MAIRFGDRPVVSKCSKCRVYVKVNSEGIYFCIYLTLFPYYTVYYDNKVIIHAKNRPYVSIEEHRLESLDRQTEVNSLAA